MMSPATLIPTPVQRIANNRGIREMRKTFHCSKSPEKRPGMFTSITPTNKEATERGISKHPSTMVIRFFTIGTTPSEVSGN